MNQTLKVLPHELSGNTKSKQLVVFMHGWPDTTQLWDKFIPSLEKDYYVLNVSYPNFSSKEQSAWGIDIPEIIQRLNLTLDTVNSEKRKVTFVTHDWGAYFGYSFDKEYPNKIDDMVALDISPYVKLKFSIVAYQSALIVGFLVGGKIGNWITHGVRKWAKYDPPHKDQINSSWNYPYYYTWKTIIKAKGVSPLQTYKPSCSIAYVYGELKPMMFHTDEWLDMIKKNNPDNEVIPVKAGHWIMKDQPEITLNLIKKRLNLVAQRK